MYLSRERLTQNEKCKFLLVKDNLKKSGRSVLNSIVTLVLKENTNVNYLKYETLDDVSGSMGKSENLKKIDAFSDPFSWRGLQTYDLISSNVVNNLSLPLNSVVLIDSLSILLIHNPASALYQSFHKFMKTGSQLIALLHSDAHSPKDVSTLETLASTVLEVLPVDKPDYYLRCLVKFPSGKVSQQDLVYQINSEYEIIFIKNAPISTNIQPVAKRPDPTANLTFNLNLNPVEKEVRDKLPLPYAKEAKDDDSVNVMSAGFNEDDFYDEEDPDDDLDF